MDVEQVQAIGRGDECCEFVVHPRPGRAQGPSAGAARAGSTSRLGPETERQRAEDARDSKTVRIGLVACTKGKQPYPCAARQMYSPSALFRKASAYCAREYDAWYILSAEYGLLAPDDMIEPYDKTLKTMSAAERRAWGRKVSAQLKGLGDHQYFAHAGSAYLKPLSGLNIVNVLAGLRMGERLQWYSQTRAGGGERAYAMPAIDPSPQAYSELTIAHLERAARWYRQHTPFNDSYMRLLGRDSFLRKLRTRPDQLTAEDLLEDLIEGFLNKWLSRLSANVETAEAIKSKLVRVAEEVRGLAHENLSEVDLSRGPAGRSTSIASTYDVIRTADGVGATITSKILHTLNPDLFVMWDDAIRHHYSGLLHRNLDTGSDYVVFLAHMQGMAQSVIGDFSVRHPHDVRVESYLSKHLGLERPVTLAKFLDEYNWVTLVRGVQIT